MASKTEICNLALSSIGVGKEIANVDTEQSQEALACRRFYEIARDSVLRAFAWPFATVFADLGLVEEDPTDEWGFSYRYPPDCLMMKRIISGVRTDTRQSRVPYKIGKDDDGLLIYTDMEDPTVEYTSRADDVLRYPPDFILALSYLLGSMIVPRLSKGDPFKQGPQCLQLYSYQISRAMAAAGNEQQADLPTESEFIRERDS